MPEEDLLGAMTTTELTWRANAEANLLQARQRHGARLGSKKSRSGCVNCKTRRVKCDEVHPSCRRCQDMGRPCKYGFYPASSGGHKVLAPLIGTPLSQMMGLREVDRRTFDFFISCTAPRLAGAWDKEFWCNHVLQLAQREPFVLDSLLAISVLYEHPQYLASFTADPRATPGSDSPRAGFDGPPPVDDHHSHALRLYNRAIQTFSVQMKEGKASSIGALLSCVLFICIETIRDNVFGAMGLFVQGTNLLKQVDRTKMTSDEQSMLALMEHIFQRMAVQATLYGHPSGGELRQTIQSSGRRDFQTLAEARSALFGLAVYSHAFMRQADDFRQTIIDAQVDGLIRSEGNSSDYMQGIEIFGITRDPSSIFYGLTDEDHEAHIEKHGAFNALRSFFDRLGTDSNTDQVWDPEDLYSQRADLQSKLKQWNQDFELLLKCYDDTAHVPEAVSYLRMYQLASHIWVSSRLETSETVFDTFTAEFRQLIRHAEIYVRATALQSPIFTFEIGAVLPLFMTASKCRVPSVRRHALDLMLRCPRKESTFGAYSCAQAICRLIAIEESGLGLPTPDLGGRCSLRAIDDRVRVPEDSRVHSFDLLKNRKARVYELRCTRYKTVMGRLERLVEDFPITDEAYSSPRNASHTVGPESRLSMPAS